MNTFEVTVGFKLTFVDPFAGEAIEGVVTELAFKVVEMVLPLMSNPPTPAVPHAV